MYYCNDKLLLQNMLIFPTNLFCCALRSDLNISGLIDTLRPRQNSRHFADDIFKFIFFNENV